MIKQIEFNLSASQSFKEIGQDEVWKNEGALWKEVALSALEELCLHFSEITSDLFQKSFELKPHHPNAYGALMRQAGRNGWIAKTGRYIPSERIEAHGRMIPIWKSLINK